MTIDFPFASATPLSMIIAMDGTVASGKGTLARRIAAKYGLKHLDTGLLYRGTGMSALRAGTDFSDAGALAELARTLDLSSFEENDLRSAEAGQAASRVAVVPKVRAALLQYQRDFAAQPSGAILDGRDIGTVVCPDATVKFWVDADIEVRAHRRWKELQGRGSDLSQEQVLADLKARDARDRDRETAPMVAAEDAHLLNTTELTIDAAVDKACAIIDGAVSRKKRRFWGLLGSKSKTG